MISLFYILIWGFVLMDAGFLIRKKAVLEKTVFQKFFLSLLAIFCLAIPVSFSRISSPEIPPFFIVSFAIPHYLSIRKKLYQSSAVTESPDSLLLSDSLRILIIWLYSIMTLSFFCPMVLRGLLKIDIVLLELLMTTFISSGIVLYLIFQSFRHSSDKGAIRCLGLILEGKSLVKIIFFPAVLGFVFALLTGYVAIMRPSAPQTPLSQVLQDTSSGLVLMFFVFLALFLAPIVEEIVFRGYFYVILKKIKGKIFAIFGIAIIFSLLHLGQYWGDPLAIMMIFLLGFALTLLRETTGSTIASMCMHFMYNLSVTILPLVLLAVFNPSYFKYQIKYEELTLQQKKEYLTQSIENKPFVADAYNDLAWIYYQENEKLRQALDFVNKALTYDEKNPAYLDTKVKILKKLGREQDAIEVFQAAAKKPFSQRHK